MFAVSTQSDIRAVNQRGIIVNRTIQIRVIGSQRAALGLDLLGPVGSAVKAEAQHPTVAAKPENQAHAKTTPPKRTDGSPS